MWVAEITSRTGRSATGASACGLQVERGRPGPGAFQHHVLQAIVDELADARASVDVRNDLQEVVRLRESLRDRLQVDRLVLVAHARRHHAQRPVVERADERVLVDGQARLGVLLREAPQLAAAVDGRTIVQEHGVAVAAFLALELHGYDLSGLGVVAEPGRIRHADELVLDDRLVERKRLRHHRLERLPVRPVGDDEELAIDEPIGARRESRARQRHRKSAFADVFDLHEDAPA